MPRKSEWIQRLEEIIGNLRAFPEGLLDRSAAEVLFGISTRQATRVLHRLGAQNVGGAMVIPRQDLLRQLERLARHEDVLYERRRRDRFLHQIEEARRQARSRRVVLPPLEPGAGQMLPADTELEGGCLTVRFRDAIELMQKLMLLAQAASADWENFERRVNSGSADATVGDKR